MKAGGVTRLISAARGVPASFTANGFTCCSFSFVDGVFFVIIIRLFVVDDCSALRMDL